MLVKPDFIIFNRNTTDMKPRHSDNLEGKYREKGALYIIKENKL